jgi:hypothetical protein
LVGGDGEKGGESVTIGNFDIVAGELAGPGCSGTGPSALLAPDSPGRSLPLLMAQSSPGDIKP